MRLERDLWGIMEIPEEAYYGPHTMRTFLRLSISGVPLGNFKTLVKSIAMVKKAATFANRDIDRKGDQGRHLMLSL